ncbi:MAG: MFS transporter [Desulfovibrio sp.]|nr:MFS transporter [Desulfovibrio sp.]
MDKSRAGRLWMPVALAGAVLMITMGIRQSVGLFLHPVRDATGMSVADISMALAVGQLMWGAFQPLFGAWADKGSPLAALGTGIFCLAAGQLLTVPADSFPMLVLAQGLLSPAGAAAGSFSVLIGIVSSRLAPESRSVAAGCINAMGSLGQFIFAPVVQFVMHLRGYPTSLALLSGLSLAALLPAFVLCRTGEVKAASGPAAASGKVSGAELKGQLRAALGDRSYLLLHAGFFTCGFHVAFLTTHLPGEIGLCGHSASVSALSLSLIGLSNIAGSIGIGVLGKHFRMKFLLALMYAGRALMIAVYLASPKTELTFYVFAVTTGLTWLATVPPTAGLVGKLFGTRCLATLFGLTLFTHQIGGFLGAWFGGLALQNSGSFLWVWYVDIALASFAALVNLPIREQPVGRRKGAP